MPNPVPTSTLPTLAAAPPDDKQQLDTLLTALEKERGRPAIVYWTTPIARISLAAELPLYDQLRLCGKRPAIDLVLSTNGGDAEAPWRFVSLIREYADKFSILLPHRAASAGTLTALGADEIVMTPMSVLGPIDPSRTHPLLPMREGAKQPEPISVQDMRHAMQFIREAAPNDPKFAYTPEAMARIFEALFDKIHPLAIGAIEQSYALAKLIGKQCLRSHVTGDDAEARIDGIVNKLCDDYKSHSYQIARKEAKDLGLDVVYASATVENLLHQILAFYTARPVGPFGTQVKPGLQVKTQIAWIDSLRGKFRAEQMLVVTPESGLDVKGDGWVPY
jgi:Periplasmic serine proteases (ClpP class)